MLLTNDDGIHAPGITALFEALTTAPPASTDSSASPLVKRDDVLVVAPLTVQSATGHGITYRHPLLISEVEVTSSMRGIAVDGRPADCVKLALSALWADRFGPGTRPDLVLSGMNMGANVGINVLYSGTVAAALEAAFLGVPAIAVSLHHGRSVPRYDVAARHGVAAIRRILAAELLLAHGCMNINVPMTDAEGPTPPMRVCAMNTHGAIDAFERRVNPLRETYFWSAGTPMDFHATEAGSDVQLIHEKVMTLTPLKYDLTDHGTMEQWRAALGEGARRNGAAAQDSGADRNPRRATRE